MGNTFGNINYCQRYPQFCASADLAASGRPTAFPATAFDQQQQQSGNVNMPQAAQPIQQQHSPLGSMAAFKGKFTNNI